MRRLITAVLLLVAASAAAQSSPHGAMDADCALCHRSDAWRPAHVDEDFDHGAVGMALRGAHAGLDCGACHQGLVFSRAPADCAGCHADVHEGELGRDCGRCHGTRSFIDRRDQLRLHRLGRFPLTGRHATAPCVGCHPPEAGQLTWVALSTDCVDCHRDDYESAAEPDHVAGNFPTDCGACHGTALWRGASFNHAVTGFPLSGAHGRVDCSACHPGGDFTGLDPACVACHEGEYLATADPDHGATGFSTDCALCHGTERWEGAVFDHDSLFFPIYSGRHREQWIDCVDCHLGGDFGSFSCIDCHAHSDRAQADEDHDEVAGYLYQSPACFDCHPRGSR